MPAHYSNDCFSGFIDHTGSWAGLVCDDAFLLPSPHLHINLISSPRFFIVSS